MVVKVDAVYFPDRSTAYERPLFMVPVAAGFPSPADDYLEGKLDLNKYLIAAGIHPGDILIVDRSIEPTDKKVVIAVIDGELTVKRIRKLKDKIMLMPENDNYEPLPIEDGMDVEIWGVVTSVIHPL